MIVFLLCLESCVTLVCCVFSGGYKSVDVSGGRHRSRSLTQGKVWHRWCRHRGLWGAGEVNTDIQHLSLFFCYSSPEDLSLVCVDTVVSMIKILWINNSVWVNLRQVLECRVSYWWLQRLHQRQIFLCDWVTTEQIKNDVRHISPLAGCSL